MQEQKDLVEDFMADKHCVYFEAPNGLKFCALLDMSNPSDFFDFLFDNEMKPEIQPLAQYQFWIKNQPKIEASAKDDFLTVKHTFLTGDLVLPMQVNDQTLDIEELITITKK